VRSVSLLVSISFFLISDIDSPRDGLISRGTTKFIKLRSILEGALSFLQPDGGGFVPHSFGTPGNLAVGLFSSPKDGLALTLYDE
jgi:hypothetical protein